MPEMMNTHEVAEYLRIKERKVYDLVRRRRIPCTRVAGKWLFPKALVDAWILESSEADPGVRPASAPPEVIVGSHDPLLEWAARESGSELAVLFGGSLDGLKRFADDRAAVCGLHVLDPESGAFNVPLASRTVTRLDFALIEWAWRAQGLIVAPGNPRGIEGLADLAGGAARLVARQEGAGSRILLEHLLAGRGLALGDLALADSAALNETDAASAVREGKAEAAFGIEAAARTFGLDFVPLARERYDLAVRRRAYFEPGFQRLIAFARGPRLGAKADEMGGYDVSGLGRVVHNGP